MPNQAMPENLVCYNRNNFGDQLAEVIVRGVLGRPINVLNMAYEQARTLPRPPSIVGLGSVLHFAGANDLIWGTGVIPKRFSRLDLFWTSKLRRRVAPSWNVKAVRGPLTRDFLVRRLGINCPEIYGDPAILLPDIVPGKRRLPVRKFGVIPHYKDLNILFGIHVCSPLRPWNEVLDFILGCELVVASSLHGLIVAEAFGVPARWLRSKRLPSSTSEGDFKYSDYYLSTGREPLPFAESIEQALSIGPAPGPIALSKSILKSSLLEATTGKVTL